MSKKYPLLNDKAWLYRKYWGCGLSTRQIAKLIGCSGSSSMNAFKKLNIPRRTISEAGKGREFSTVHKKNLSEAHKGQEGYWGGKHRTEETRRKISDAHKGKKGNMFGKHHSEETKQKISESEKGKKGYWKDKHLPEETKAKMREARKHRIFPTHHTKPELVFEGFCKQHNLPFRYTGDGSFWVGEGKDTINPDFVHLRRKVVVEIFSWHHDELNNRHVRPKGRYEVRKKIFKKYGYKMIVFWQDDLDREDAEAFVLAVLKKVKII